MAISQVRTQQKTVPEVESNEVTPLLSDAPIQHYESLPINGSGKDQNVSDPNARSIFGVLSVLLVGVFVSQADGSLMLATYGTIASEFDDLQAGSWLISSYMLANCMGQPLYGKLSDIFGRKAMLQISQGLFALGSLLCGCAQSMPQLIAARAIQGFGGGGMVCLVSIIITDIVPLREVASYRSYVNVVQTAGRSSGGAIGGILAEVFGWRWTLAGQAPLTAIAMLLVAFSLNTADRSQKPKDGAKSTMAEKLARIDFSGAFFMSATIISFLLILDLGGERVPWNSPIIYSCLAISLFSGVVFTFVVSRAPEPIFPLHLLSSRAVLTPYMVLTLQTGSQVGLMFLIPMYFQVTINATPGQAGAYMVASIIGNTFGGLLSGYFIKRTGRYKLPTIVSALCSGLCFTLLLIFWRGGQTVGQSLFIFLAGFGTGIAYSTTFVALAAGVKEEDIAVASSGLYLCGSVGAVSGLSAVSAVFQGSLRAALEEALIGSDIKNPHKVIRKALSDVTYVQKITGKIHSLVLGAYISGFQTSFFVCLGLSGACLLASLALKERRLG